MPTCSTCGAEFRWVLTEAGKRMPIDPEPVPDGNVIPVYPPETRARLVHEGKTEPLAHVLHKDETPPEGTPRFVSHYATCPQANQHRKRS